MGKARWWRRRRRAAAAALILGGLAAPAAAGATIRGRVVTADGAPAAGARIWAARMYAPGSALRAARADADGRFAIEAETASWAIEAILGDQGTKAETRLVVDAADPEPITIRIRPGGRLRGRLVEAETGRPIAGGRFVLDNGEAPVGDADGRFEAPALSRAYRHEAVVVAPGRERLRVFFEVGPGATTDLEVAVPRGGKVVGLVIDPAGRPIPGAIVGRSTGEDPFTTPGHWVRADEKGHFAYDGLRPGQEVAMLLVAADGFVTLRRQGVRPGPRGEPTTLLARLDRAPVAAANDAAEGCRDVAGVVADPDGRPVAAAVVVAGFARGPGVPEARTDAAGRFRLARVPGQYRHVATFPPDAGLVPTATICPPARDRGLEIRLERGQAVAGVVRDDGGTPLAHVRVTPTIRRPNEWNLQLGDRAAETDAEGRFALLGMPAANLLAGFDNAEDAWDLANQPLAGAANSVTMVAKGVIRGRVVDAAGRPVRSFRVLLSPTREAQADDKPGNNHVTLAGFGVSCTADDGSFAIRGLAAGSVQRVAAIAPGHGVGAVDRVIAEPHHSPRPDGVATIRLGPPHALAVRVADAASGAPIPGARVALLYDGPAVDQVPDRNYADTQWTAGAYADADAAGAATFAAVAFDEAIVLVQAPGYLARHVGWRDGAGTVAVRLRREANVAGLILDRAGDRPLAGSVRLSNEGFNWGVPIEADGRFRIDSLSRGTYTLMVYTGNNVAIHQEEIVLEPGDQARRTLRLDPARAAADRSAFDPDR